MKKNEQKNQHPHIINGRSLAHDFLENVKKEIQSQSAEAKRPPGLATVLVGNHPASRIYVEAKRRKAEEMGIESFHYAIEDNVSEAELIALIDNLNNDPEIDGILVQMPLPGHMNARHVLCAVDPLKDVDGFHPENAGRLFIGNPLFVPCTPKGILHLISGCGIDVQGKQAVVVGRSTIVGKPMAALLTNEDATVTLCHQYTQHLEEHTKRADILVVAIGQPKFFGKNHVKEGAIVIDVGINRVADGSVTGDVDTNAVIDVVKGITPVPNGVGPMTIAMLMDNTRIAHALHTGLMGMPA
jgi:methylenetetrahydrofolate dehydrogenase (NADP+)/methenyltetrahydrofolate cyclohydrolase